MWREADRHHDEPAELEIRTAWISLEPGTYIAERWDSHSPIVVSHESAALLHQFGDGIMSAINCSLDFKRVEHPGGDRVHITIDGKYLPYDWVQSDKQ